MWVRRANAHFRVAGLAVQGLNSALSALAAKQRVNLLLCGSWARGCSAGTRQCCRAPCIGSAAWTLRAPAQAERGSNAAVDTQQHIGWPWPYCGPCAASNTNLAQSGANSPCSLTQPPKKPEWRNRGQRAVSHQATRLVSQRRPAHVRGITRIRACIPSTPGRPQSWPRRSVGIWPAQCACQ